MPSSYFGTYQEHDQKFKVKWFFSEKYVIWVIVITDSQQSEVILYSCRLRH